VRDIINTCYGYLPTDGKIVVFVDSCYQYMLRLSPLLLSIHVTVISPSVINTCYGYLPFCYQYMLRLSPLLLLIHVTVISPPVINTWLINVREKKSDNEEWMNYR
jgi:hypothetical protein